jgi:predicted porin
VGKILICALAITGIATAAHAADLGVDSLKDPVPDNLTWHGVTLYGTIDVGGVYQTKGAGVSGNYPGGLDYTISGAKGLTHSLTSLGESGMEQSKIGVKIEEGLGHGWVAVGKLEVAFNPLSGELVDGLGSLVRNNGQIPLAQNSNGDSSRAGQAFAGPAYAGVSNQTYGTLTFGRQQSLMLDALANYDPQGLPYAFSILGYSGFAGGAGDTEVSRWDNSVKYVYQYGPLHAAAMYSDGGADTGLFGGGYGFNVGGTYKGFSIDAIYQKEKGAVSASALSQTACGPALGTVCPNEVSGTISDNTAWSVQGKYTFDFGGGFKDEPGSKLTLFAGYENIDMANPSSPVAAGSETLGGYVLYSVNNTNYYTDRVEWIGWGGAKYEVGAWTFTGAYYHYDQAAFLTGSATGTCTSKTASNVTSSKTPVAAGSSVMKFYGDTTASNCAGTLNDASFVVDYRFNKHFDVYAGVNYSDVGGGVASGYAATSQTSFMTGARLKF